MRSMIPPLIAAAMLLAAPGARAAPTCLDQNGATIKCGEPNAMPVGWVMPPEQRANLPPDDPVDPEVVFGLICVLGGFFALIALMPEFDGWRPGDWDRQEDDDRDA